MNGLSSVRRPGDMTAIPLLCIIPLLLSLSGAVDVPVVSIEGTAPNENYLRVGRGYELVCSVRAGYDETVTSVSWLLYGKQVYSWSQAAGVQVSPPLLGHVETQREGDPARNIAITSPSLSMAGDYICVVESTKETVQSEVLTVYVIKIGDGDYETKVELLSNILLTATSTTTSTPGIPKPQPATEVAESPDESLEATTVSSFNPALHLTSSNPAAAIVTQKPGIPTAPTVPPADCVLVWWFLTPAIAPRPVVKCGFYDHTSNSLTKEIPGGLLMNQLPNGSWRAQIDSIRIPVASIPPNQRLGCIVTIPKTSYREVVKFEDGLSVDTTIDSVGCPSLSELHDFYGILVSVTGDSINCRGEHVAQSEISPAVATISCPSAALFKNKTQIWNWGLRLECSERQTTWRLMSTTDIASNSGDEGMPGVELGSEFIGKEFDINTFDWPYCIGGGSSASALCCPPVILLVLFFFLIRFHTAKVL